MNRVMRWAKHLVTRPIAWLAPRVGLRWRITLGFAVGALLLSTVLSGIAYGLTRENLLDQREAGARNSALNNADTARNALAAEDEPAVAISGQTRSSGAGPLLRHNGRWYPGEGVPDSAELPDSLVDLVVNERQPARMRFDADGSTYIAIGLPLEDIDAEDASYFFLVPLDHVSRALESLTVGLAVASVVTALGGAFVGWLGARRTFRPLDSVRVAAKRIGAGDLNTRVDAGNDPDLMPLAYSFNHMIENLRDRIEQDARFSSNVTHELRSPLTTLSASLAVLENLSDELPDRAQQAVDLLSADVNRFTQLIEDLLEISRLDAGVVNVEPDEVMIAELIMYAVEQQSAEEIPVDVAGDLAGVIIRVDKRRLLRVIANLLDNAAKYASGADRVEIALVDDMVQVAVEDTGPGIAPRDRLRVFDRFSRGWVEGERAKRKGVGLGLSIVAEHVRIHGGDVWVEGRADGGEGARFVFTLPVDPDLSRPGFDEDEEDLSMPVPTAPADSAASADGTAAGNDDKATGPQVEETVPAAGKDTLDA